LETELFTRPESEGFPEAEESPFWFACELPFEEFAPECKKSPLTFCESMPCEEFIHVMMLSCFHYLNDL
jgi:hypothetical protein